jgi:hypothetical protein
VRFPNQTICRKCGQPMQEVANISPIDRKPGPIAYLCPACGGAHSVLVYPEYGPENQGDDDEGRGVSDHAER